MIKNYLKIAWRNLMKNKVFTSLNIIGLSVAFAVAILLSMAAFFELSYNNFHDDLGSVYQVYHKEKEARGVEVSSSQAAPTAAALKKEIPGVDKITRYLHGRTLAIYQEKELSLTTHYIDPDFFSVFSFSAIDGDEISAIKDKNSIVITKKVAKKVFGEVKVLGKTLNLLVNGKETPFTVGAILEDIPKNSSLNFEMLINFEVFPSYESFANDWSTRNHDLFVKLADNASVAQFEEATKDFVTLHYQEELESAKRDGAVPFDDGSLMQIKLLPFKDTHFTKFTDSVVKTSRNLPYLVLSISFLVLFIACVNFVNMSIASSGKRLKEIGMRKTLGAHKKQLFFQFWSESLVVFLISLLIGSLLSYLLLGKFQALLRTTVEFNDVFKPFIIIIALLFVLIVSFISGGYPAFLMSKLETLQALKGKLSVKSGHLLRNILTVVQFGIAILLITGTIVLWSQLDFMRTKDLGYNKEQVISFMMNGKKDNRQALALLRNELESHADIINISAADNNMGRGKDGSRYKSVLGFDYKEREVTTNMLIVENDYSETLDLDLVAGRTFDKRFASDSLSVMINEKMAKSLNEENPLDAKFMIDSVNYSVIGILKDYHFEKLDQAIQPITFFMRKDWGINYAFVKIAPNNITASYDKVKAAWNKIEPNAPFLGSFLDENIDRTFNREKTMITMISSGSIIAIVLSCIGLFAMSLLIVSQRTKEIGIRKVVGASVSSITYLLTKDFLKLVGIAFLIASPVAYWLLSNWLQEYAYRIKLNFWFFALSGIIAVVIAVLTIGVKTIKAAFQNPTKSLRTE